MTHRIILVDIGAGLTLTGVLPSVALNADYNARLQARGGQAPYAYTIVAGALPVGLQLDLTTGTISGTATVAGHASFTVRATDITGAHVQRVYSIRVVSEPLSISGAAPAWTVGTPYSYTYGVMHGSPPYTWSIEAGALPAGITLNASTGTISGTPTAPNAPAWTVRVTDSDGAQADLRDNASMQLLGTFNNATIGTAYTSDLAISGGDLPYGNARVTVGVLPSWAELSIVGAKLRLSGTPTGGATTVNITVAVDSSSGQTATSAQSITISAAAVGYSALVMEDGPLAYWKADETSGTVMADSSGNGFHAAYSTATGVVLGAAPLRTDSVASLATTAAAAAATISNSGLNVAGFGANFWALEAIVLSNVRSGVFNQFFGSDGNSSGEGRVRLMYWRNTRTRICGRFNSTSTDQHSPNATSGSPTHVIFERDGTDLNLYENGVLVATQSIILGLPSTLSGPICFLGSVSSPGSYAFSGSGSDFAIYDHALGASRALAHAQAAGLAP